MIALSTVQRVLEAASEYGDFGELFFEQTRHSLIERYYDRLVNCSVGDEYGVGIRILYGLNSAYVYSNDLREETLIKLVRQTADNLKTGARPIQAPSSLPNFPLRSDVSLKKKMTVLRRALDAAKNYDSEISQAMVRYIDINQELIIANTEGLMASDHREKTRMMITAYARNEKGLQSGYVGPGAMQGFDYYDTLDIEAWSREAARIAITNLHADKCKGGLMPVVVDNGFGGLLFHEACGHSLESSSVSKGLSEFSGKLGQAVASPVVTLIDDGSLPGEWGSLGIDDEGLPTRRNVLIENGILKSYLIDRLGSRRMGLAPTGSARRQNYRFAPVSRMTNTFIAPGESKRSDIIATTERGLFVKGINGGSVNPATGDFNFAASESYMIENGKITRPVSGATLIGKGGQVLQAVDMVADNLEIRQGYCYAGSGALFIGAGQPTIRVAEMLVGGAQ